MDTHVKVMFGFPLVIIAGISMMQTGRQTVQAEGTVAVRAPEVPASSAASIPLAPSSQNTSAPQPTRSGASMLEQAILDAFPNTQPMTAPAKTRASQASDLLAAAINSKGYLCAQPVEAQKADASHYGVRCITRRSGEGRSNYLFDVQTGEVTPF
jgi:hypothetical protein